jgi:DNA-binding response OmpR family regulator
MGISGDQQQVLSAGGIRWHIVVIDDAQDLRALYREFLTEEGFAVSSYGCDEVDVAMIAQVAPDLIVLDGLRPGGSSGWSILRTLKLAAETDTIPVVLCTAAAHEVQGYADDLVAMAVPVVLKPFNIDELLLTIRDALRPLQATVQADERNPDASLSTPLTARSRREG